MEILQSNCDNNIVTGRVLAKWVNDANRNVRCEMNCAFDTEEWCKSFTELALHCLKFGLRNKVTLLTWIDIEIIANTSAWQ